MTKTEEARILVIDDDESVRKSLRAVLKENGYLVDVAENGKEAIAKSKANFYNLALVDLRLPDIDGIELLTTIRETIPKMVRIIITGYPSLENAIEAVNRGADGYMVKPYSMDDLLRTITEQLQKQREAKRYITERKRMEEEVQRASQFVETILENVNVWFDVLDENANVMVWNKAAELMSGYTREEVVGHAKIWEWLYPDEEYRKSITDTVADVMRRGRIDQDLETRITRKDGQIVIISWNQRNLLDEKGKVTGSIAIGRDITERKQMEGKLRTLHGHATQLNLTNCLDEIVKNTLDAMEFTLGFDQADFDMVENGFLRVKGSRGRPASPSELPMDGPGVTVKVANTKRTLRVPDTSKEPAFLDIRTVTTEGRPLHMLSELTVPVLMDGEAVAVLNVESTRLDAFIEEDQILLETLAIHVSSALSRLRRMEALRASELKYRTLFENIPHGVYRSTPQGAFLTANPALVRMLGYESEAELLAVDISHGLYVNPEDREAWIRGLEKEGVVRDAEIIVRRKDGGELTVLDTAHVVRDERGRVLFYEGTLTDITERKRMESTLREQVKELNCLHGVARSIERFGGNFDAMMSEVVSIIPLAYAYPDIACARIVLGNQVFESAKFNESKWKQSADIKALGNISGTLEVYYLEEKPRSFEGPFAKEERALIDTIAERLTRVVERNRVQDALRESEVRYRTLFDSTNDAIFIHDMGRKFLEVNRVLCELTGHSHEELLQMTPADINSPEYARLLPDRIAELRRVGHAFFEAEFVRRDGTVAPIELSSRIIEYKGKPAVLAVARDITERKQMERMKDQFVSTVSHELRTPLTSIRASLGLLASGVSGTMPEKGQRMLEIAVTNTDRLVRLINDILDSERLASGKTPMEKKTCNAGQLVTQAADVMKPMAEKAGISLSVESQDAALWADPDRIAQALTNLVSNAIKFSPKGGRIWVTAERKENQMLFKVRDEGRGIPPDKLGLLFERFQQVDASDAREKGGTGLGLSISRSIVEQHSGRIWVESTVGKGSTFFFTLPLPQETEVPAQPEAMTEAQSAHRVLIIEDDPDLANILATMLQRHDIQPCIAHTAGKGIALSKQMHPDMIVLDLGLPDMDGSAVVQALREDNILRSLPLVVYTVRELNEQQRENLRLGETLFFTKSRIPPDQFEEKVVQFMKRIVEKRGKASVS